MSNSNRTASVVEDVVDVVGDTIGDLTDDLGEIAEVAVTAAAETTLVGIRLVSRTARFVARHPREVVAGIAIIAVVIGVMSALRSRSDSASTT